VVTLAELHAGVLAAPDTATAVAHDIPVVSQDANFEPLDGIGGLSVVRV